MTGDKQAEFDDSPDAGCSDGSVGEADRSGLLSSRLEQVLDATDTVVWEADLDGMQIEYIGPAQRVAGLDPSDFSDLPEVNVQLVHPDDQLAVARRFETLLDGDAETVDSEFRTNPANGPVRWLRTQVSVEQHRDGTPTTLVGLSTDITPLKEREARLEEFAGIVSHDLRNPLSVAMARVELAQDIHEDEHLAHAQQALDRMEVLIENLLTLARSDQAVGNREPVALNSVVGGAWDTVDTGDANLLVEVDRTVRADRTRLQQLLENLVRNAVEHGSTSNRTASDDAVEHGSEGVTVRVGPLADGFFVEDDGVGIPETVREVLFTPTRSEHTGLGLRIVQQVVDAHDWSIRATESDAGGARFEITGVEFA